MWVYAKWPFQDESVRWEARVICGGWVVLKISLSYLSSGNTHQEAFHLLLLLYGHYFGFIWTFMLNLFTHCAALILLCMKGVIPSGGQVVKNWIPLPGQLLNTTFRRMRGCFNFRTLNPPYITMGVFLYKVLDDFFYLNGPCQATGESIQWEDNVLQ